VGINAATQQPGLRRARGNSAGAYAINEELVEGVENMQLLFGQDTVTNISKGSLPIGNITTQKTASAVTTQTNAAGAGEWRRVGMVQVGLVLRSPGASSVTQADAVSALGTLGTTYNASAVTDGRYRTTYEASIALRNRLFGN
jgi:type IV pilus assembly protein PilW